MASAEWAASPQLVASEQARWREEAKGYLAEHRPDIPVSGMSDGWLDINVQDVSRKRGDKYPPRRPASGAGNSAHVTRFHHSPGIDPSRDGDPIPRRTQAASPPPLAWLSMATWDTEPIPERQWAIHNRVPLNQAGLFSGEGGTGKSIIELHKNVAHVAGKDWLGSLPEKGPAFYIGAEDDKTELHIRLGAITKHCGVTFAGLVSGGLHVLPLLGQDATLCYVVGKSGKIETTDLYKQLYQAAGDIKPKNISIDILSRAFAGAENDRVQVYGFASHMQALAMVAGGSVTILSHPSLSGINSGSGISGSTAWHGAFRFRQYLTSPKAEAGEQPETDLRQLEFRKNQYGPLGETIALRYRNGLFLPLLGATSLDKVAQEAKADDVFLDLLRRFALVNRNVGDKTGTSYAPALFAKEDQAKKAGLTGKQFEAAMRRLFAAGKIWNEPYGRASRPSHRLAI